MFFASRYPASQSEVPCLLACLLACWLVRGLAGLLACSIICFFIWLFAGLFFGGVFVIVFRLLFDCVWWVFGGSSLRVFPEYRDGRPRRAEGTIAKCKGNMSKWFWLIVFRCSFLFHYIKPRGTESENGYDYKSCGVFFIISWFSSFSLWPWMWSFRLQKTMAGVLMCMRSHLILTSR